MLYPLIVLLYSTFILPKPVENFAVRATVLNITGNEEVTIKVSVENLSDSAVSVFKYRRKDYKREKIRALGNYVIEVQKWENNEYLLFQPTADMDPVFENQQHILLQKGEVITDTLWIDGIGFTPPKAHKRGFPAGKYRVRIYFNPSMWKCTENYSSNWVEFSIE